MARPPMRAEPGDAPRIQSIGRAKAILDVIASANGRHVPLRDIAGGTGLLKTTAFNLVTALAETGLVERDPRRGYRLGLHMLIYGRVIERQLDIVRLVRPHLVQLSADTRETVNLALPCPTDVVIAESLEGGQGLRVSSYAGTRAAYHSTACGRALLAFMPIEVRRKILTLGPLAAQTPKTCVSAAGIETLLAECRRLGYVSEVEENETGAACVAAPIRGAGHEAVAAVSIAGPLSRMSAKRRSEIGRMLVARLAEVERELSLRLPRAVA